MTNAENESISGTGIEVPVVTDPIPSQPAPGADEQKPIPTEAEDTSEEVAETTEQQEAKKQSKFQRRLDRQKSARVAAETETRLLREQLAKLEAKPAAEASGEPLRDQFDTLEDYTKALALYAGDQAAQKAIKADREARQSQETRARASAGDEKITKDWSERETAFQAVTKDYSEVVQGFIDDGEVSALSEMARRAILESDVGPQVLHHLATNPEDAERITELSPARQVAELGKLELKMTPAKRGSNAPAPIKSVASGRSAAQGYSENMSDSQYREWRKSQGARWAR